jgi:hypothetical protein
MNHFIRHPNAVDGHLRRLRAAGLVTWQPGESRTLRETCRVERVSPEAFSDGHDSAAPAFS